MSTLEALGNVIVSIMDYFKDTRTIRYRKKLKKTRDRFDEAVRDAKPEDKIVLQVLRRKLGK